MITVFLGLGSNLSKPINQVKKSIQLIDKQKNITVKKLSSLYVTTPVGNVVQDDFINAVIGCETTLNAHDLLAVLQTIELDFGRVRTTHWGPRVLDIDILLYGDQRINTDSLTVPHPEMHQRGFVLVPLAEIAPDIQIPGLKETVSSLAEHCDCTGVRKLALDEHL